MVRDPSGLSHHTRDGNKDKRNTQRTCGRLVLLDNQSGMSWRNIFFKYLFLKDICMLLWDPFVKEQNEQANCSSLWRSALLVGVHRAQTHWGRTRCGPPRPGGGRGSPSGLCSVCEYIEKAWDPSSGRDRRVAGRPARGDGAPRPASVCPRPYSQSTHPKGWCTNRRTCIETMYTTAQTC